MAKSDNGTYQKTVRLPREIIDYVEQQEGKDFSKKLVNLLDDVMNGDARRREMLITYDKEIADRRARLSELSHKMYSVKLLMDKFEAFHRSIENIIGEPEV